MLRSSWAVALWLCVLLPTPRLAGQEPVGPVGLDGWRQDLEFVVSTIKAVHPRAFHRVTSGRFDSAVAVLERRLPKLSDVEAALGLFQIVALINDGHTAIRPGGRVFALDRWYPVRIDRLADGFFVVAASPAHRDLVGAEVTRIGGRPVGAVWDTLMTLSAGDNRWSRMSRLPIWLMMPELISGLGLAARDRIELEVVEEGRARRVGVAAIPGILTPRLAQENVVPGDSSVGLPASGSGDLAFQRPGEAYWFRHDRATGLLYAQINQIQNSEGPVHLDDDTVRVTLGEFGQRLLARIDSGGVRTLVVDLRNNGGGNNYLTRSLVYGIAARPAINTRGRLFVITGRQTYSAAMNTTSLFEAQTASIFVGEPPGGAPAHYGDASAFELPASRLRLMVSTLHWNLGVNPTDLRDEQEPEIWAPPRIADFRSGRDGALAAIRAWRPGESTAERLMARYRQGGIEAAVTLARELARNSGSSPWGSVLQQLDQFGSFVIRSGAARPDIYRALALATELYPDSPAAWFTLGRSYWFGREPRDAEAALARARALRPTNDLIVRLHEAVRRQ